MQAALRDFSQNEMKLLSEVGPVTIAGMGWLTAQVSGLDPSIANLIGNGITVAVLAWYVIYDVRVRTPALLATFNKEQDEIRRTFREEQLGSRELFKSEQSGSRQTFTIALDALLKDGREDRAKMREQHAAEIADWRSMLNENMTSFRTAVHDVANKGQAVVSGVEQLAKQAMADRH